MNTCSVFLVVTIAAIIPNIMHIYNIQNEHLSLIYTSNWQHNIQSSSFHVIKKFMMNERQQHNMSQHLKDFEAICNKQNNNSERLSEILLQFPFIICHHFSMEILLSIKQSKTIVWLISLIDSSMHGLHRWTKEMMTICYHCTWHVYISDHMTSFASSCIHFQTMHLLSTTQHSYHCMMRY